MIATYKSIKSKSSQQQFPMPLSLRYIKELSAVGIDYKIIHLFDLTSLVYSIRIDNARQYLERIRQEQLSKRGIKEVRNASSADFDAL